MWGSEVPNSTGNQVKAQETAAKATENKKFMKARLICSVWQGRAVSAVCREKGDVNLGKFLLQFWEPKSAERDLTLVYRDCWSAKWVVEKHAPELVTVDSVVYATWSKIMDPRSRTIPKKAMECALANLERANLVDP